MSGATAGATSGPGFNWVITTSELSSTEKKLLEGFLLGVFAKCRPLLGYEVVADVDEGITVRFDSSYELSVRPEVGENVIHSQSLTGAGEILPKHGHQPILMMIYLQNAVLENFTGETAESKLKDLIYFSDEGGELFEFSGFESLEPLITKFGFDYVEVEGDAIKIGLAPPSINISSLETERENLFF